MIDQRRAVDHQLVNKLISKLHGLMRRHADRMAQKEIALALAGALSDAIVATPCPHCREATMVYVAKLMQSAIEHAAEEDGRLHLH